MKINLPVRKGIIFAGCSFTWGQGLYYYSNLPTLREGTNSYKGELVTESQIEYMKTIRFPRLVSNHFNTFELVDPLNGGSHLSIINWWKGYLNISRNVPRLSDNIVYFNEVSHIVFQLTQCHRCVSLQLSDDTIIPYNEAYFPENRKLFERWMKNNNIDLDNYLDYYTSASLNSVKEFLMGLEEKGLKCIIINWPKENVDFIKNDKWITERFLPIEYKDIKFYDMDTLLEKHPEMSVAGDFENFEQPPKDSHPSKKCHRVIADNIIKRIENE